MIESDPRGRASKIVEPYKHPTLLEIMNRQQTWAHWYQEIKAMPKASLQSLAERDQSSRLQESAIYFLSLKPKD